MVRLLERTNGILVYCVLEIQFVCMCSRLEGIFSITNDLCAKRNIYLRWNYSDGIFVILSSSHALSGILSRSKYSSCCLSWYFSYVYLSSSHSPSTTPSSAASSDVFVFLFRLTNPFNVIISIALPPLCGGLLVPDLHNVLPLPLALIIRVLSATSSSPSIWASFCLNLMSNNRGNPSLSHHNYLVETSVDHGG